MHHCKSLIKLIVLAAVLPVAVMGATLPKIAGGKINAHTKLPVGWLVQAQKADKDAVAAVKNAQGLSQPLVLAPQKASGIFLFAGDAIPSLKGDVYDLSVSLSGTGKVQLGFCAYSAAGKYLYFQKSAVREIQGTKTIMVKDVLEIADGKDFPVANIRPGILVLPQSKITVSEMTLEESEE